MPRPPASQNRPRFTGVNWLPLFHDMGLLASVATPMWRGTDSAMWRGTDSVIFDPVAFLRHPPRWLKVPSGRSAAHTCAPNFACDYCLRRLGRGELEGSARRRASWPGGWTPRLEPQPGTSRPETSRPGTSRPRCGGAGSAATRAPPWSPGTRGWAWR